MSAPDDHAVLDGHQFLDVVALHVKVGLAFAAYPAAPSTAEANVDRYEEPRWIGIGTGNRRFARIASDPAESPRPPLSAAVSPEVRRERAPGTARVARQGGWARVAFASRTARVSPARRRADRVVVHGYFGNITRALPRLRPICGPASRLIAVALSVRLENEHHEREGWARSESRRDSKRATARASHCRSIAARSSRAYQINSIPDE